MPTFPRHSWLGQATPCAESREKVHALLGLSKDTQRAWEAGDNSLKPDYTKTKAEVVLEVWLLPSRRVLPRPLLFLLENGF